MDTMKILNSPFDIDVHKATFVNYLEVIILEDGTVTYAVPSHQQKMIDIACNKLKIGKQELYDMCPPEYSFDVITWLSTITGAIAVWDFQYQGIANETQLQVLDMLRKEGLYKGK